MNRAQPRILLTGFGPFPGVPHNVTGQYVEALAAAVRRSYRSIEVQSQCLPTAWQEAPLQLEHLYYLHKPTIALHFGVSHLAKAIVVETTAKNCTGRADVQGIAPELDYLVPGGAQELRATVPVGRLVARVRKVGVPAVVSHDAGAYLCNALLYHSIELMSALEIDGQCGFIHLPVSLPQRSTHDGARRKSGDLDFERAIAGGLEIVGTLLGMPPDAQRSRLLRPIMA